MNLLPFSQQEKNSTGDNTFLLDWLLEKDVKYHLSRVHPPKAVYPEIWRGGHPRLLTFPDTMVSNYFESYMRTYVERDIRTAADIGSLQTFGAFIRLAAAKTATEINYSELGRELGIDRKTALRWIELLEATFQWVTIPAFSRNPVKRILSRGKGIFTDTGFTCYLQKIISSDAISGHPLSGSLFETFAIMEIIKQFQSWDFKPNLYHFRSYSRAEVNLILELNGKLFPIEIKSKSNPSKKDIKGIQSLKDCFPTETFAKALVICAIEEPSYITEDILAIPWWLI